MVHHIESEIGPLGNPQRESGIPLGGITTDEYRSLWPQRYEPWCAEMEVFHNPYARHRLPKALLPEVTHWFDLDGEMVCESFYETSILWSQTLIQKQEDRMPTLDDFTPDAGQKS